MYSPQYTVGAQNAKKYKKYKNTFVFFTFLDVSVQNFIKKFFLNCWGQVLDV